MKSLKQFLTERRHVGNDIINLANYVYDTLEKLVNTPAENPKYKSLAYELCKESGVDEYDIEMNFEDVPNFNYNNYNLLRGSLLPNFEYDCDFVVRLSDTDCYGTMDTSEPILEIGVRMLKTPTTFKRQEAQLRNTLIHELTHYVQYMAGMYNMLLTGNVRVHKGSSYERKFADEIQEIIKKDPDPFNNRYYTFSFIIYAFTKNERDARVSGFYGTVTTEFERMVKEYKKLNKKIPTKTEFVDFVVNNNRYNETETHIAMYDTLIKDLENDTYENYKKCVDDPNSIYGDDSMVYVYLNMCDHLSPKPEHMLPTKHTCIYNTRTEAEYETVRNKILNKFKKNYNEYKHKLSVVVGDIYDDMMNK